MSCKEASDIATLVIVFGGAILGFLLYCWINVWSAKRDLYRVLRRTYGEYIDGRWP